MKFKTFMFFLMVLVMTGGVSCTNLQPVTPKAESEIVLSLNSTVAFVTNYDEDDEETHTTTTYPYCSGAWIAPDTMVSALHCIKAAKFIEVARSFNETTTLENLIMPKDFTGTEITYVLNSEVTNLNEEPKDRHLAKVVATDSENDLAILSTKGIETPIHSYLKIAKSLPNQGEKVVIVGHPGGLYFTFMDGVIASIRNKYPQFKKDTIVAGPVIQIYSGIYKGNSGGPVISSNGELLGIVSFSSSAPNQGFAIPCTTVTDLLNKK